MRPFSAFVWAVLIGLLGIPLHGQDEPRKKLPVPSSSDIRKTEKEIRRLYEDYYKAKDRASQRAFAGKLLEQAAEPDLEPLWRYVFLQETQDVAAGAQAVKTGLEAGGKLIELYDVDPEKVVSSFLSAVRRTIRKPAEADRAGSLYLDEADKAVRAGHHDAALAFAREAEKLARTARNTNLLADARLKVKQIPELEKEASQTAEVDLTASIDLGATKENLVVGRYLCFVKDDWEKGLEYLLYAGNSSLEEIARQELGKPTGGETRMALAEDWLTLAGKERSSLQERRYERRAFYWFEQARSVASSLTRVRIDKRLNELVKKGLSSWRTRFGKGIVGAWDLDEGTGSKATDRSGRGFHGVMNGFSSGWKTGDPFAHSTLEFDGSDDYIEVDASEAFEGITDAMTFAVWVNRAPVQREFMVILSRQVGDTSMEDLLFAFTPDGFVFLFRIEGSPEVRGVLYRKPFPSGTWHHVAATYDVKSGLALFIDGEEVQRNPLARGMLPQTRRPLLIGANHDGPGEGANAGFFPGKMARLRIYDRALSAEEVELLAKVDR